jgi:hypothetical protein
MICLRTALPLALCLGWGAVAAADSADVEAQKLILLSCLESQKENEASATARNWLNNLPQPHPDKGLKLKGPYSVAGACVQDVTIAAAFGAMIAQGRICNARLEDFREALSKIGLRLEAHKRATPMDAVLAFKAKRLDYLVYEGVFFGEGPEVAAKAGTYSFLCARSEGGAQ